MAAVWPAGPEPMMTSLECMARVWRCCRGEGEKAAVAGVERRVALLLAGW